MDPSNFQPGTIDPSELPEGFTATNPDGSDGADLKQNEAELKRQGILEQCLEPSAFERLKRIKLVKKERVEHVEKTIVSMAMQRKLPGKINEGKLIEMLENMGAKQAATNTSKISIQRKKYAFDSDDSDDNDDDLL